MFCDWSHCGDNADVTFSRLNTYQTQQDCEALCSRALFDTLWVMIMGMRCISFLFFAFLCSESVIVGVVGSQKTQNLAAAPQVRLELHKQ